MAGLMNQAGRHSVLAHQRSLDSQVNKFARDDDQLAIVIAAEAAGQSFFASQIQHACAQHVFMNSI